MTFMCSRASATPWARRTCSTVAPIAALVDRIDFDAAVQAVNALRQLAVSTASGYDGSTVAKIVSRNPDPTAQCPP